MAARWTARIMGAVRAPRLLFVAGVLGAVLLVLLAVTRGDPAPRSTNLENLIAELESRVSDDPQSADLRVSVAAAYYQAGYTSPAIEQFREALVLEPDNQTALIGLGKALLADDDLDGAEAALLAVLELNADNEFRYMIRPLQGVYYDLARIAMARDGSEAARDYLLEALKINRTDADVWRLLGQAEQRLGNLDAAEEAYLTAVRFVPDYIDVYRDLEGMYKETGARGRQLYAQGMIRLSEGSSGDAVKRLETAVAEAPGMAVAHEALGMAYEEVGRPDDALVAYRAALQLDPEMFISTLAVERLAGQ